MSRRFSRPLSPEQLKVLDHLETGTEVRCQIYEDLTYRYIFLSRWWARSPDGWVRLCNRAAKGLMARGYVYKRGCAKTIKAEVPPAKPGELSRVLTHPVRLTRIGLDALILARESAA